jgi:predicted CXXCH cytochrome family protein
MLLIAAGTLWLFLAAIPALADGGPHVSSVNSGVSTLTSDSCAGCHRAHTAAGELLINAADDQALCLTCHGTSSTGATTSVMDGVQYAIADGLRNPATTVGALRGGGFDQARLDAGAMSRLSYLRTATAISQRPKVGVGAAEDVTSAHIAITGVNNLTLPGKAWGNGTAGSGAGPAATVSCVSCHNPHGNGQFRILNTIPAATGVNAAWTVNVLATVASNERIYTEASHALLVGDVVTIAGTGSAADGIGKVVATVSANYFTLTGVDILADTGAIGTVTRTSGVPVSDATLAAAGDTRNYTVMQVKGTEGTESTYLLYSSQVLAAAGSGTFNGIAGTYTAGGGDYFARNVPWNPGVNNTCDPAVNNGTQPGCATANSAPNGRPTTFSGQITAWCASCHTRYFANNNPNPNTADPLDTGASWLYPRPNDSLFNHQHRTVAGRDCMTCHVSHGSNAAMTGTVSSAFPYPDATVSASSRLLKVDNRGTCQACHDPTGTVAAGTVLPVGADATWTVP